MLEQQRRAEEMQQRMGTGDRLAGMEVDDGMQWADEAQARLKQQQQQQQGAVAGLRAGTPPSGMSAEQVQSQQRQQQIMEAQEREIQRQQQLEQDRQRQMAQQAQVQNGVRKSPSRERLDQDVRMTDASQQIDPADATETRKLTVTPPVARDERQGVPGAAAKTQEEERKRRASEDEEARRKSKGTNALGPAVSSGSVSSSGSSGRQGGGKLRKERGDTDDEGGKDKKKKTSMFGGLFTRKKDKKDRNPSIGSFDSNDAVARASEDSNRSGSVHSRSTGEGFMSPVTAAASAMQQQQVQQVQPATPKAVPEPKRPAGEAAAPLVAAAPASAGPAIIGTPSTPPQVSQHASQLRQRDQQQQALYQQYLNRSPSSPPEAQPSYGLQSASIFNAPPSAFHSPTNSGSNAGLGVPTPRPRPGSLILTGMSPDLSVIRVFAGKNLQTEATFKTVLLNSSTTSEDLVRQAIQRFRLPGGDDENDYYLTVKQVEGGASAVLRSAEKPLVVFETLTEAATELPKVKRSSVGSISSVASNLSMHPAIRKLPMNDFTDDSAVKFYLNRRNEDGSSEDEFSGLPGDETLVAETSFGSGEAEAHLSPLRSQYLSVGNNVTPERFSSPSFRFALQMVIYPEDLPEDMAFDPLTEAIVPKETLRGRPQSSSSISTSLSQTVRRKVFIFPKNVTVAEVIELGLERFGIPEGVVDGGDEVEDKMSKRRSSSRVRYGLTVDTGNNSGMYSIPYHGIGQG